MNEDKSFDNYDGLNIEFKIKTLLSDFDLAFPNKLLSKEAFAEKWELKKLIISRCHKIDRLNIPKEVE
jgi:hypothetical protein